MFTLITINHFRAIKVWGEIFGAKVTLDALTFELEVKALNRYVTLYPQFIARINQKLAHVPSLTPEVTGFIGWRPYKPFQHPLSTDKLRFKTAALTAGMPTPPFWVRPQDAETDFVIKSSIGSFGNDLTGPFPHADRQKNLPWPNKRASANGGEIFAESFVHGRNIKVWFWGAQPVHAQNQAYARLIGDGQRTAQDLMNALLLRMGQSWRDYPEKETVIQCLSYQQLTLDSVLPRGLDAWPDYRYGRQFSSKASTEQEDNALPRFSPEQLHQIQTAGNWLAKELSRDIAQPVLLTLDGVQDGDGRIWWLEMNTNPVFPPTGYFAMLASLFGTAPDTPAHVFSRFPTKSRVYGGQTDSEKPGVSSSQINPPMNIHA